jgi:hypothetical protein
MSRELEAYINSVHNGQKYLKGIKTESYQNTPKANHILAK